MSSFLSLVMWHHLTLFPSHPMPYLLSVLSILSLVFLVLLTNSFKEITNLPNSEGTPAYTLIATQTPPPPTVEAANHAPDFTAIVMNLIRLESESTDILITINVPHIKGEYTEEEVNLQMGKQGKLIGDAVEYAARIWETFKIKDWGLFSEV
jgi:hypothetical protein